MLRCIWCSILLASLVGLSSGCGKKSAPTSENQASAPTPEPRQKQNPPQSPTQNQSPKADADLIQGTWAPESAERDGKKASAAELKGVFIIFSGDKMITKHTGGRDVGSFKLDPTKVPKTIDLGQSEGDPNDVSPGIYELSGDNLKVCYARGRSSKGAKRPSAFETKPGSDMLFMVLKRDKSAPQYKEPDVRGFPKAIIGKWKWEGGETNFPFLFDTEFTKDGSVLQLDPSKKMWGEKYKYRFEKGTLILTLPEKNIHGKTEERVRIKSITDDQLIAESPFGKLIRLK